jgi:hypothetical protein
MRLLNSGGSSKKRTPTRDIGERHTERGSKKARPPPPLARCCEWGELLTGLKLKGGGAGIVKHLFSVPGECTHAALKSLHPFSALSGSSVWAMCHVPINTK